MDKQIHWYSVMSDDGGGWREHRKYINNYKFSKENVQHFMLLLAKSNMFLFDSIILQMEMMLLQPK